MEVGIRNLDHESHTLVLPPSKSLSHRYLIAAALAEGRSEIRDLADNDDLLATASCLGKLGVKITREEGVTVVESTGDLKAYDGSLLDCHESGSTLRFLLPVFAQSEKECLFTGQGRLLARPLSVYEKLYQIDRETDLLRVRGSLAGGEYHVSGDISSQFISGLLFVLPLLAQDSLIKVEGRFESVSYVDLTIAVLAQAGIEVIRDKDVIKVKGRQKYQPFSAHVAADDSQAVFFAALAVLGRKEICLKGNDPASLQGDHVYQKYLKQAGALISEEADIVTIRPGRRKAFQADLQDCPDLGPMLFALAAACEGTSTFTGIRRLRLKESDRVAAMCEELRKLQVECNAQEDVLQIIGRNLKGDVEFSSHNDHRIAMALAVLACAVDGQVLIKDSQAVNKSYPGFYEDLHKTGVEVIKYD